MTVDHNQTSSDISDSISISATADDRGRRLDAFLAEKIDKLSRSAIQKIIADGDCLIDGKPSKSSYKLRGGEEIEIDLPEVSADTFAPEDIPLNIVFEDEYLLVINKPAGMVVHPGAGVSSGTLANAVAFHLGIGSSDLGIADIRNQKSEFPNRIGLVHRLDKDTSGLIVVAKSDEMLEKLSEQFRDRTVYKSYVALVHGEIDEDSGTVEAPIAREKHNRTKMGVRAHGRYALSHWRVKKRFSKFTLVGVEIKTGRTHQIRVHLAHINHPVVGDDVYNSGRDKTVHDLTIRKAITDLGRFFLHSEKLSFTHPVSGDRMNFAAPLPPELSEFIEMLEA